MYTCTCGHSAETEGELISHVIERHVSSYGVELYCPLGAPCLLTSAIKTVDYEHHTVLSLDIR
jgi:hypothetical protein